MNGNVANGHPFGIIHLNESIEAATQLSSPGKWLPVPERAAEDWKLREGGTCIGRQAGKPWGDRPAIRDWAIREIPTAQRSFAWQAFVHETSLRS
ncbi:hypothetical protein D9M68_895510 [compost metagenome]